MPENALSVEAVDVKIVFFKGGSRGDQSDHATKVKIGQKIGKLKCQSSY